ncbi:MAG: deoxyhypusine synthase [Thaumarchaeota archaeon]|nr:deoxyhypusine synthase [Nitrososphaerota archaeon]
MKDLAKKHHIMGNIEPMRLPKNSSIIDLVRAYEKSTSYNSRRLAEACRILDAMIDEDATICVTLAGAMIPAGMGGLLNSMMEAGFIDFMVATGANLYHDLHFALGMPVYKGDFRADDAKLLEDGLVRIYDIYVPMDALLETDKFVQGIFKSFDPSKPTTTSVVHNTIGKTVLKKGKYPEKSVLATAAKYDVPIFSSSPGDSSIGMNLAALKIQKKGVTVDPDLDVLESTSIVMSSKKNGVVIVGGGSPKNFYMQTQPMLSQIFNINKGGHDYVVQITADYPQYGGLSGATPEEAVSWGKVVPHALSNVVVIYSDATLVLPTLFGYALASHTKRKPRRLFAKRIELVEELRKAARKKN